MYVNWYYFIYLWICRSAYIYLFIASNIILYSALEFFVDLHTLPSFEETFWKCCLLIDSHAFDCFSISHEGSRIACVLGSNCRMRFCCIVLCLLDDHCPGDTWEAAGKQAGETHVRFCGRCLRGGHRANRLNFLLVCQRQLSWPLCLEACKTLCAGCTRRRHTLRVLRMWL